MHKTTRTIKKESARQKEGKNIVDEIVNEKKRQANRQTNRQTDRQTNRQKRRCGWKSFLIWQMRCHHRHSHKNQKGQKQNCFEGNRPLKMLETTSASHNDLEKV